MPLVDTKALPPVATLYHFKLLPVAVKLATVAPVQKLCGAAAGALGELVTTYVLVSLSVVAFENKVVSVTL